MCTYIDSCIKNKSFHWPSLKFNVDGILYEVSIYVKLWDELDVESNSNTISTIFSKVIQIVNKKWKVRFWVWSTDTYKKYIIISTNQDIDIVRESISSLTRQIGDN